jgi:hypothetical protein
MRGVTLVQCLTGYRQRKAVAAAVAALALAGVAGACRSSPHRPASSPPTSAGGTATTGTVAPGTGNTATGGSGGTVGSTPTSIPATTTTTSPGGSTPTTPTTGASGPARCNSGDLRGSLTEPNGAAGSTYYMLVLTNTGTSSCLLQGYPGVSWVTGSSGQQVGAPAERQPGNAPALVLAPGTSAQAVLRVLDAGNFGASCGLTPTDGLRVYPPNDYSALFISQAGEGCTNVNDVVLYVAPFQ